MRGDRRSGEVEILGGCQQVSILGDNDISEELKDKTESASASVLS
jgi:hypothetical protein